jgi:glycosyltransferase involved in cell wall biosynthesis
VGTERETERPLRVLVIDHTAPVRSVRQRWNRLVQCTGCELTLLSPPRWPENSAWTDLQGGGDDPYRTIVGAVSWPGHSLHAIYLTGILRAFRESRPDVIVMMEEAFSLFAAQAWLFRKLFARHAPITFYACWILPYENLVFRPAWLFRWLNRAMLDRLDAGMSINDRATRALEAAGFPGARTNFFGVDETVFVPMDRLEAREEVGIGEDDRVFLYAGRLLELKGVQDLIAAFERVCRSRPYEALRLIILGSGEYGDRLRSQAAKSAASDRIEFRGPVPNELVRTYMSAADAFVLPSRHDWHEQFGRVLAEAMLVKTTVIGSTSGEIPRAVGDGGFIFEADNVDDLARTIERVLDDPSEVDRRVRTGREIALRDYSVAAFVDRTIEMIEELTDRPLMEQTSVS